MSRAGSIELPMPAVLPGRLSRVPRRARLFRALTADHHHHHHHHSAWSHISSFHLYQFPHPPSAVLHSFRTPEHGLLAASPRSILPHVVSPRDRRQNIDDLEGEEEEEGEGEEEEIPRRILYLEALHMDETKTSPDPPPPPSPPSPPILLAILDDYANTAPRHFAPIPNVHVTCYPETLDPTKPEGLAALAARLRPYHVISSMRERTPFPAALLARLPALRLLLSSGARNAALDLAAFRARGIPVTGTRGDSPPATSSSASSPLPPSGLASEEEAGDMGEVEVQVEEPPPPSGFSAVNQHAWALLLSLCGRIPQDDRALKTSRGAWQSGLGVSLGGKKLGVLGLGKLGSAMARTGALAFGMEVVAWSENLTQERADLAAEEAGLARGAFRVAGSKEELFRTADVVSCHLVLSARTRGIVGERELGWMKRGRAILLNTSRGGLIDEGALMRALAEGAIGGFATDVFWEEPLAHDSAWRRVDEWAKTPTVLSPHMGYVNAGTMNRWYQEQAENLSRWLQGQELLHRMA